jgi:hypothetical protein
MVTFDSPTAVTEYPIFCAVMSCHLVEAYRHFGRTRMFKTEDKSNNKLEASRNLCISETSVTSQETFNFIFTTRKTSSIIGSMLFYYEVLSMSMAV